jgi:hypothetical protein
MRYDDHVNSLLACPSCLKKKESAVCCFEIVESISFCFVRRMKFRIKCHTQTQATTFDDVREDSSLSDLKIHMKKQFASLRKLDFYLSLNGRKALDEDQTVAQSGLVNGDTIYILTESQHDQLSLLSSMPSADQPLMLDEVRDSHTYPISVHRLVEDSQPESEFDLMVVVLHALMLESGFHMVKHSMSSSSNSRSLFQDAENNYNVKPARKSSSFYVIRYRHKLCEEERLRCSLAIMKTDSLVTIDGRIVDRDRSDQLPFMCFLF